MKTLNSFLLLTFVFISFQTKALTRQMEYLDRGVVAVKVTNGVFLSWRFLGNDDKNVQFNLYRNGTLVNTKPISGATNYTDAQGTLTSKYVVKTVLNGNEISMSKECTPWGNNYKTIQLNRPKGGTTPDNVSYVYTPNDMSVADLDGDGEYELIVKWDPGNAKDNSQSGYTGNVYLDAYKLDGTQLWRIDLGINIRAGAHYTQFMVYDLDGDGMAELVCKTAPGTIDGAGKAVLMGTDKANADYRNSSGYILTGPEYLTVFDGLTGAEVHTIAYEPGRGKVSSWEDNYGNRVDRFLACIAYIDGVKPSVVMCRGYYTRAVLVAYSLIDKKLTRRWTYDSGNAASATNAYGQGTHNLSVGDVDGDGYDEIMYGSAAIDHNGKLLYNTQNGHGDACHLSDINPDRPGLEFFMPHESSPYGFHLRDAATGEILYSETSGKDNGRALAADIDPKNRGLEFWSNANNNVYNCKGKVISTLKPSTNFRIYWDGDLQDELLDGNKITKWNSKNISTLLSMDNCSSSNGTKATPNISADILGDWREEVILYESGDPSKIRIYTTTIPTEYRLYTLMHDPIYRLSIAWQNVAYNQPPHLGFYIGDGLENIPYPDIYVAEAGGGTTTGSENIPDNSCKVYAKGEMLYVNSPEIIQSVLVYSVNGLLLSEATSVNKEKYSLPISSLSYKVLLVKVVTKSGVKTTKIMR